jgi:nitrite reductase/ring-hydroxylating ferredoxin subunit
VSIGVVFFDKGEIEEAHDGRRPRGQAAMTVGWVSAGQDATLAENEARRVDIPGAEPIAVFRLSDGVFATDDTCTHGAASLAEGFIEGGEVECPFHSGRFDIRTGAATYHPCTVGLRTYPVRIEGREIIVDLTSRSARP